MYVRIGANRHSCTQSSTLYTTQKQTNKIVDHTRYPQYTHSRTHARTHTRTRNNACKNI